MTRRTRRILSGVLVALLLLVTAVLAFVGWGPVPISNKRVLLDFMLGRGIAPPDSALIAERIDVPDGFHLQVYSTDVPLARFMAATPAGDLIVTRTRADSVSILERDRDGDGRADGHRVLLDGFHQTKTIAFGPDGWLYLSQGSTCNVCVEKDPRRATIMRMRPDGSGPEIYATGLRNSVGFDWAPWDGTLYATENGRDLLGDDFPPDELNRIEAGGFYGWPYFHGDRAPDPEFGSQHAGDKEPLSPVHGFQPHNAPLGIHFLRSANVPAGYERTALVALHGSWNRTTPDGYKVVALRWLEDGRIVESDFMTGFLSPDGIIGRPAGVIEGPDGAIFVSDDYAGVVYRITAGTP